MKFLTASVIASLALAFAAQAEDVSVKLSKVHLCCKKCVTGAEKAVADVDGAKVACDQEGGVITVTGGDTETVQKAVAALVKAGYFGESDDKKIKVTNRIGTRGKQVQTMTVEGVHLCCDSCAKAVHKAVSAVDGVKGDTAAKNVKTFEVTGDFNDKDVLMALEKAGLAGHVARKAAATQ